MRKYRTAGIGFKRLIKNDYKSDIYYTYCEIGVSRYGWKKIKRFNIL